MLLMVGSTVERERERERERGGGGGGEGSKNCNIHQSACQEAYILLEKNLDIIATVWLSTKLTLNQNFKRS